MGIVACAVFEIVVKDNDVYYMQSVMMVCQTWSWTFFENFKAAFHVKKFDYQVPSPSFLILIINQSISDRPTFVTIRIPGLSFDLIRSYSFREYFLNQIIV